MPLAFRSIYEDTPGPRWKALFMTKWPAYQAWFLQEGDAARPSYEQCAEMLEKHMPELVPTWKSLVALAGGSDLAARMLSLYRPTPYAAGCSQAILDGDRTANGPILVRNYDYIPALCEGVLLSSCWHGTKVIAMNDCLWGATDGMNDRGLAASLTFGGRSVVGDGFGMPLVLRYVLEVCRTTREAIAVLERVPSHMAYNVSIVDAAGEFATVEVAPDRPPIVLEDRVATNHQREGSEIAATTRTIERKRVLDARVADPKTTRDDLVRTFLEPPVFNADHAYGLGTLYTAAYEPRAGRMQLIWPEREWKRSFDVFEEAEHVALFAAPAA
jgi:predicted choloylglycine hydrolase